MHTYQVNYNNRTFIVRATSDQEAWYMVTGGTRVPKGAVSEIMPVVGDTMRLVTLAHAVTPSPPSVVAQWLAS